MLLHRDESDDTLFETDTRMPEKDYTHIYEERMAAAVAR